MTTRIPTHDLLLRGLNESDIQALEQIAKKYKEPNGKLYTELSENEHIDIECEGVQYPEEAMDLFMSYITRE